MTTPVISVPPTASVRDIASLLHGRRISAVPVVDANERLLGIVSEGDLIRRPEMGTERQPSWWLRLLADPQESAMAYVKSHGGQATDVMTREVISVSEDAQLEDVAETLEKHRIKRVPVLRDGKLVGIVSRADLLHGLIARKVAPTLTPAPGDDAIRAAVQAALVEAGGNFEFLSVVVAAGVVHLWGAVDSSEEKRAAEVAATTIPGVRAVRNELGVLPLSVRSMMWAE